MAASYIIHIVNVPIKVSVDFGGGRGLFCLLQMAQ